MFEDRISQLPDAILQQILSFLDANEAVQTSILSTRWKNLCFSLTALNFHLTRFAALRRATLSPSSHATEDDLSRRFSAFVSHFLSHRNSAAATRTFDLSFDTTLACADIAFVEECVRYAVNHGVGTLRLRAHSIAQLRLPASKTLRKLVLVNQNVLITNQLSLPHLKTLYLESSSFASEYDKHSKEPFSGFPELEKLTLNGFCFPGLVLRAPKLRILEVIDQEYSFPHHVIRIEEIFAPLLASFRYEGLFPLECSKVDVPMLEEVYLDVYKGKNVWEWVHLGCVRLLGHFGNAKIVALSLDTLKILEMDGGIIERSPCPFPYMKCLKLMKGSREIGVVLKSVMEYLTVGNVNYEALMVEFPADHGVAVVDEIISEDLCGDDDDDYDEHLYDTLTSR